MTDDKSLEDLAALDASKQEELPAQPAAAEEIDPLLDDTARSAEAELFPPLQPPEEDELASDQQTFASAEAPWVGAEKKWLVGEADVPGEVSPAEPARASEEPLSRFEQAAEEDDALLTIPQIPVLQSIVPPPPAGVGLGFKLGIAGVLLAVVASAGAVVYWMSERFSEREQEILDLRLSDRQDVARLERQIQELLAQGGAENEARATELRVALGAARMEASATDTEQDPVERDEERRRRRDRDSDGEEDDEETAGGTPTAKLGGTSGSTAVSPPPGDPDEADLLDSAFTKPANDSAPQPPQGTDEFPLGALDLPQSPSREQVRASMDGVAPRVKSCGPGSGRIVVSLAVAGSTGRVVSAEPAGDHAGTPIGLCVARAVKLAKFPRFKQDRLPIKYPFDL